MNAYDYIDYLYTKYFMIAHIKHPDDALKELSGNREYENELTAIQFVDKPAKKTLKITTLTWGKQIVKRQKLSK